MTTSTGNGPPVVVVYRGGNGALGVARTLGRLGVPVVLVAQAGMVSPLLGSRYWRRIIRWDFGAPESVSLEFLRRVGRELESEFRAKPLLLTLADWVAIFIERQADALSEHFVFPRAPEPVVHRLADKSQMAQLAVTHGLPTPTTILPGSRAEALDFVARVGYPIVLKPSDPYRPDSPPKRIVESRRDLVLELDRLLTDGDGNVVLQEYIPGDAASVWMCNAYLARDGECVAVYTGKKLRQVEAMGIASLAVCLPNATVADQTRTFMRGVGYRGCVGIGYRYDARDGLYKVLDVNPRVSGVFRLFAGTNDLDVVRLCHRDFRDADLPTSELLEGRKWLLEDDFAAALRELRAGRMTLGEWRETLRGLQEAQWFARDDPLPLALWIRDALRRRASAAWQRPRATNLRPRR